MVVGQSSVFTTDYQKAKTAAANIFALIDRTPEEKDLYVNNYQKPTECKGNIEFRGVEFCYPNRREAKVLKGLSFSASKGRTVALVGSSGCGKSTCIQLIEKFYNCSDGSIVSRFLFKTFVYKQFMLS